MALFKILRGNASNLPHEKHDGWAYFTTDTHEFYIDYKDSDGEIKRGSITQARMFPRLSSEGVYYFETLNTPIPTALFLSCGGAQEFDASMIYDAGIAETINYDMILKSV